MCVAEREREKGKKGIVQHFGKYDLLSARERMSA